jgi:hypothetical protein
MARRQRKYYEKPHVMAPEIARRFRAIIEQGKKEKSSKKPTNLPKPRWMLFRWDTLEDVDQGD